MMFFQSEKCCSLQSLYLTCYTVIISFPLFVSDNSFWWASGRFQGANRSGQPTPCGRSAFPVHFYSYTLLLQISFHDYLTVCVLRYEKKWKVPYNAKTLQEVVLSLSQYILTVSSLFLFPLISNQAVGNILVLYAVLFSLPGWQADSYYKTAGPSVKYEWLIFYKKTTLNMVINKIEVTSHKHR